MKALAGEVQPRGELRGFTQKEDLSKALKARGVW